jgi:hypothetical protein
MYMYVQLLPLLHTCSMLATVATVASIAMHTVWHYIYNIYILLYNLSDQYIRGTCTTTF